MMSRSVFTATGIILKRRNWGEADKIITLYTREFGKIRVLAKGVRKIHSRRAGFLEPFQTIKITVHSGKNLDYLSEAVSDDHKKNTFSLSTIGYAYFLCEVTDKLTPQEEANEDIYFILHDNLQALQDLSDPVKCSTVADTFAQNILRFLGYLEEHRNLPHEEIIPYVERIIDVRLKSPKIIAKLG